MDQATIETVQTFLRIWEVRGGLFPWVSMTMAIAGGLFFLLSIRIHTRHVRPYIADTREGLQAICVGVGALGAALFIICGLVTLDSLHAYILWSRDPQVFALQKLIRALKY